MTCNPERGISGRRNITGIFQHSEAVDRAWNPGGLWRPVLVYDTGPAKLDRLRVLCRDADETRAHLRLYVCLDSDEARTVRVRTTAAGVLVSETEHPVAAGNNEIEWALDIDRPQLWWPRALGDQPLTDVDVELLVDGEVSDRRSRRTGLREVAWNDWVCSINGERLFLKAANIVPTRPGLADATPEEVRRDVELAVEAGLDAVRVQAHIAHPELYHAADELGVLVLQDFPLQWGYAHQIRREAVRQVREAVNTLGHHPSIVQWCAHDEPVADAPQVEHESTGRWLRRLVSKQLPTWNKSVLDRWLKRAFEHADPTRPAVAHSGVRPYLPRLDGTDTHLWLGWHRGDLGDLAERARLMPSAWCASSASSAPSRSRTRPPRTSIPHVGRSSTGSRCASTTASRSRSCSSACLPTTNRPTTPGAAPPSATRSSCCATTSRRCDASSTGQRAGSPSRGWPIQRR